jgi:hypothetical protein
MAEIQRPKTGPSRDRENGTPGKKGVETGRTALKGDSAAHNSKVANLALKSVIPPINAIYSATAINDQQTLG